MLTLLTSISPQDPALLDGIQGNILKAHGRHHTANMFIRCTEKGKQSEAKAWLKSLVEGNEAIVQSGYGQLRSNVAWKNASQDTNKPQDTDKQKKVDTGLFACIHISAAGYDYLFGKGTHQRFDDTAFQNGMKKAELNDPPSDKWEEGLKDDNHFMLLLAHANPDRLREAVKTAVYHVEFFASIAVIEKGDALFNVQGAGIEHFGYVDGVSQPLFFDDEWEKYKTDNHIQNPGNVQFDPRAQKELVLLPDPFVKGDPNAMGSYFVFRKLEQNVKGFKQAEEALADQLGLVGDDEERAGAMLVGRFEDGTPVQLCGKDGLPHSALRNNFDYLIGDAIDDGSRCPYHAHVRKVNPRSGLKDGGMAEAKKHIMARRGITFGNRIDDPNGEDMGSKPEGDVGLLFMSYQASISNQFEFIQKNWANEPLSPHLDPKDPDGIDPVIGQNQPRVAGNFATTWDNPSTLTRASFSQFVHMKGGDYFFAPSMSFLKTIDTIQIL